MKKWLLVLVPVAIAVCVVGLVLFLHDNEKSTTEVVPEYMVGTVSETVSPEASKKAEERLSVKYEVKLNKLGGSSVPSAVNQFIDEYGYDASTVTVLDYSRVENTLTVKVSVNGEEITFEYEIPEM